MFFFFPFFPFCWWFTFYISLGWLLFFKTNFSSTQTILKSPRGCNFFDSSISLWFTKKKKNPPKNNGLAEAFFTVVLLKLVFLMVQKVKNPLGNAGDSSLIPGSGRSPGKGNGYPLQYSLPGKFHGQRSLAGYSLWDHKESDTTEQLTLPLF